MVLKSCPLCGSIQLDNTAHVERHHKDSIGISCIIRCKDCGLRLCQNDHATDNNLVRALGALEDRVNERWNTRVEATEYHKK